MTWETPCGGRRACWSHLSLDSVWNRSVSLTSHHSGSPTGFSANRRPPWPFCPHQPLTQTLEPYTATYVSTVIRVIANYIHNCLTHVRQTYINSQRGFLTKIDLNLRCFKMLTVSSANNGGIFFNIILWTELVLLFTFLSYRLYTCVRYDWLDVTGRWKFMANAFVLRPADG